MWFCFSKNYNSIEFNSFYIIFRLQGEPYCLRSLFKVFRFKIFSLYCFFFSLINVFRAKVLCPKWCGCVVTNFKFDSGNPNMLKQVQSLTVIMIFPFWKTDFSSYNRSNLLPFWYGAHLFDTLLTILVLSKELSISGTNRKLAQLDRFLELQL